MAGASQASLDCRAFLGGAGGSGAHVLSASTDELALGTAGWSASLENATARVSGPVPDGIDSSLFDSTAASPHGGCYSGEVTSLSSVFERRIPGGGVGLTLEWWGWQDADRPYLMDAGCTNNNWNLHNCVPRLTEERSLGCIGGRCIRPDLPPNGTETTGASPLRLPNFWRGLAQYAVRLSGYFVPPVSTMYRLFPMHWMPAARYLGLWLSTDHNPQNRVLHASGYASPRYYDEFELADFVNLTAGESYYVELLHFVDAGAKGQGQLELKVCMWAASEAEYELPYDVGAANHAWEDQASMNSANWLRQVCHPNWQNREHRKGPAPSTMGLYNTAEHTSPDFVPTPAGWGGSHAIEPAPASFFRPLPADFVPPLKNYSYTLSAPCGNLSSGTPISQGECLASAHLALPWSEFWAGYEWRLFGSQDAHPYGCSVDRWGRIYYNSDPARSHVIGWKNICMRDAQVAVPPPRPRWQAAAAAATPAGTEPMWSASQGGSVAMTDGAQASRF